MQAAVNKVSIDLMNSFLNNTAGTLNNVTDSD
jgi:hypothetical protein